METLFDKIGIDITGAMYARDVILLDTLRMVKKDLLEYKKSKESKGVVTDEAAIRIMQKAVKTRTESAEIYRENNRPDLEEIELAQIRIIEKYIPELMSEPQIRTRILEMIGRTGVTSIDQIGTFLKAVMPEFDRVADRQLVSKMARSLLTAYEKHLQKT